MLYAWYDDSATYITSGGETRNKLIFVGIIRITKTNAVFQSTTRTLPASATACDLSVSQLNGNIYKDLVGQAVGMVSQTPPEGSVPNPLKKNKK